MSLTAPEIAAGPARDWSADASLTALGTPLRGNPAAPIKVVAYLSLTCPHCAVFEAEAAPRLAALVRSGQVSWEVRHALRDPFDLAATLLARCGGPRAFFAAMPEIYARQETWLNQGIAWAQARPEFRTMPPAQSLPAIVRATGLDKLMAARGLAPARQNACLADTKQQQILSEAARMIWQVPGFPGTPAFTINGQPVGGVLHFDDLDRAIRSAKG